MKLSAPIYRLKRQAHQLARQEQIPLHQALDLVAQQEGFSAWSHLSRSLSQPPVLEISKQLKPGEMMLIAARPGQGKTLLALQLAIQAMEQNAKSWFYSLEWTQRELFSGFEALGVNPADYTDRLTFDDSDLISGPYICQQLNNAPSGSMVVVDYLQQLDQRRDTPAIQNQLLQVRTLATEKSLRMVFISQVVRDFDGTRPGAMPALAEVRRPNPLDLSLFDHFCSLHEGEVALNQVA